MHRCNNNNNIMKDSTKNSIIWKQRKKKSFHEKFYDWQRLQPSQNQHRRRQPLSLLLLLMISPFLVSFSDAFQISSTSSYVANCKSQRQPSSRRGAGSAAAAILDVCIDQPIMETPLGLLSPPTKAASGKAVAKTSIPFLTSVFSSLKHPILKRSLKFLVFAGLLAFAISLASSSSSFDTILESSATIIESIQNKWNQLLREMTTIAKKITSSKKKKRSDETTTTTNTTIPLEYTNFIEGKGKWGRCTLESKRQFSKHIRKYTFCFPKPNHSMKLKIGQVLSLSCLKEEDDTIMNGEFHVYYDDDQNDDDTTETSMQEKSSSSFISRGEASSVGKFSILVPSLSDHLEEDIGTDTAKLIRCLENDLEVGDELALQPGENKFRYDGDHFPVTDIVYIVMGTGIVPVLNQIRAFLPKDTAANDSSSSSVRGMSIVWICENKSDFDNIDETLKKLHSTRKSKLTVHCIIDNMRYNTLADNTKIDSGIEDYLPGTMMVLSGMKNENDDDDEEYNIQNNAIQYLIENHGYPENCICIL